MNGWQRISDFLALRRNTVLLLAVLALAGTGERLWLDFAPKYLETLGAGVLIIGLFDALLALLGAVYAWPRGWLTGHPHGVHAAYGGSAEAQRATRRELLVRSALAGVGIVLLLACCFHAC